VAKTPGEIRQAFVELSYWPLVKEVPVPTVTSVHHDPGTPAQVPAAVYRRPAVLEVYRWQAAPSPAASLSPEVRPILNTFLEFSRFPILIANDRVPAGSALTWLDLRFSVPGRTIPFVLKLHLDQSGRLTAWDIGGARLPFRKSTGPSSHPG
jgi:hypothetical protein